MMCRRMDDSLMDRKMIGRRGGKKVEMDVDPTKKTLPFLMPALQFTSEEVVWNLGPRWIGGAKVQAQLNLHWTQGT